MQTYLGWSHLFPENNILHVCHHFYHLNKVFNVIACICFSNSSSPWTQYYVYYLVCKMKHHKYFYNLKFNQNISLHILTHVILKTYGCHLLNYIIQTNASTKSLPAHNHQSYTVINARLRQSSRFNLYAENCIDKYLFMSWWNHIHYYSHIALYLYSSLMGPFCWHVLAAYSIM